jgi:hypothetical protein
MLGFLARERREDWPLIALAALAVLWMAMDRGFYWNLFGRGHGWWTLNRVSALIAFAALLAGPAVASRLRR